MRAALLLLLPVPLTLKRREMRVMEEEVDAGCTMLVLLLAMSPRISFFHFCFSASFTVLYKKAPRLQYKVCFKRARKSHEKRTQYTLVMH